MDECLYKCFAERFFGFVVAGHSPEDFASPTPVLEHLRRSFDKVSGNAKRAASMRNVKNVPVRLTCLVPWKR